MNRELLMVFAKVPRPGACKTRLAASVGNDVAAALADAFLGETLRIGALAGASRDLEFHFAPREDTALAKELAPAPWRTVPQTQGDLGTRLAAAFEKAFAAGFRRVVAIGADSPQLESAWLDAAFEHLRQSTVVVGPAEDGGYYLIGLSRPHPELFETMAWSTPSVLKATLLRCRQKGLKHQVLPASYDVDTLPDLHRLIADLEGRPERVKLLKDCRALLARVTG